MLTNYQLLTINLIMINHIFNLSNNIYGYNLIEHRASFIYTIELV